MQSSASQSTSTFDQQYIDTPLRVRTINGPPAEPGASVIKEEIARDGSFGSGAGRVIRKLGRPGAEPDKIERTGSS